MPYKRGGDKRAHKKNSKKGDVGYRDYLRTQVLNGMGHRSNGFPEPGKDTTDTFRSLKAGYNF
jgi:hypothetical protein